MSPVRPAMEYKSSDEQGVYHQVIGPLKAKGESQINCQ